MGFWERSLSAGTENLLYIFYDLLGNDKEAEQSGAILLSLDILHKYTCIFLYILLLDFIYTRVYNRDINKQRTAPQIAGSAASGRTVGTSQGQRIKRRENKTMTNIMTHMPKTIMIESNDGVRYEYFGAPIRRSNIDSTIVGWAPTIRYCRNLKTGSTHSDERVTVEYGQAHFKEMLSKGFNVVKERSFV